MASSEIARLFIPEETSAAPLPEREENFSLRPDLHGETNIDSQEAILVLRSLLQEKSHAIAPEIFARDEAMAVRIEGYEKDLDLRLSQPDLLLLGEDVRKVQLLRAARELVYDKQLKGLDLSIRELKSKEGGISQERSDAERAIAHAGRGQAPEPHDFSRILGRIKVRMASLALSDRLSLIGRTASVFIKPARIHPEIKAYSQEIARVVVELNSQEGEKREFSEAWIRNRVEVSNTLARLGKVFFQSLDNWAVEDFDRFLVHAFYYPERRFTLIQSYRRVHSISPRDFEDIEEDLRQYFLLPSEVIRGQSVRVLAEDKRSEDLQVAAPSETVEASRAFAHPLFFLKGDRVLEATNRQEIGKVLREIIGEKAQQSIPTLTGDLLALAVAKNPLALAEVKKISGGRRVQEEIGADHRWAKKGRRILFSLDRHDSQTVIIVSRVIPRHGDNDYGTGR